MANAKHWWDKAHIVAKILVPVVVSLFSLNRQKSVGRIKAEIVSRSASQLAFARKRLRLPL